jgi:hypothetical protein
MALSLENPRDVRRVAVGGLLILVGCRELFALRGVFATFIGTGVVHGDFVAGPVVLAIVAVAAGVGILAHRAYNLCFILCCFGVIGAAGMVSYHLHWRMNEFYLDWGLFTPFVIFLIAFLIGLIYLLLTQPEIVLPPVPEGPRAPEDPRWRETLLASLSDTGVEPPKSRARKGAVALAAYILIAGGIAIVGALLPQSPAVTIIWILLVVAVLARVRNHFLREMWRAYARSAQDELRRPACRHPVLYLRSFTLDAKLATPSLPEILLGLIPLADAEQTLTREMRKVGPVIAIGRPGEALPALGAARFYVSHERWKEKVAEVVRVAELVVWATGVTEGLRWEISHLIESLPPEKLVLWAHPQLLRVGEAEREAEWKRFREMLGGLFPRPLPERLGSTRFFYFTPEHEPIAVGPSPFRNAQRSALRKLLRAKGYPKPDPVKQARIRMLRWVTAAAAAVIAFGIDATAAVQYRQYEPEREADAWSELVLALYNAERNSKDDVGHPDKILQAVRQVPETYGGELPPALKAQMAPIAKDYIDIFAIAHSHPDVEPLLYGATSLILGVGTPEEAKQRLGDLKPVTDAIAKFVHDWAGVTAELAKGSFSYQVGNYALGRINSITDARAQFLASEAAMLQYLIDHPDGWKLTEFSNGSRYPQYDNDTLKQGFSKTIAARNTALKALTELLPKS